MSLMETYGIKEDDFGGRTTTIITGEHCAYEYVIKEETGDVVNDAVYARNRSVEELLNVTFQFVTSANWSSGDPFYDLVRNDVLAGDSAYDTQRNQVPYSALPAAVLSPSHFPTERNSAAHTLSHTDIPVSAHNTEAVRSWNPSYIQYPAVPACWKSQIVPPEFRHSDMHSPQLCCETKSFFDKPK